LIEALDTGLTELLFILPGHCRNEGLREDQSVLHQVGDIKNQPPAPGFSVQYRETMRQTKDPGRSGRQSVSEIIPVVKISIGQVGA